MNTVVLIYVGSNQPFNTHHTNRMEAFNEFMILEVTVLYTSFTNFVPDYKTQFQSGWIYIGVISLGILVNLYPMFKFFADYIKIRIIKNLRILKQNEKYKNFVIKLNGFVSPIK